MKPRPLELGLPVLLFVLAVGSGLQTASAQLSRDESELSAYIVMPEELLYRIKSGSLDYVLVDVRDRSEYLSVHIAGALNLPWEDGSFMARFGDLPRDKTVILLSSDGTLALKALRVLLAAGYESFEPPFREALSVEGGIDNWPYREYLVRE